MVLALLKSRVGTFISHIPSPGVAPAGRGMSRGKIQFVTGTSAALLPFIKDGLIKPLAVTCAQRSGALPNVPSMAKVDFFSH